MGKEFYEKFDLVKNLFKKADEALYEAKNNGRNRVMTSQIAITEE